MSKAEIAEYNSTFGEKCEGCKDKFGPGDLLKYEPAGQMLCEDCYKEAERSDEEYARNDVNGTNGRNQRAR